MSSPVPSPQTADILTSVTNKLFTSSALKGGSKRKIHDDENTPPNSMGTHQRAYYDYGRTFARIGSVFSNVFDVIKAGVKYETVEVDESGQLVETLSRDVQTWNALCIVIPGFQLEMITVAPQPKLQRQVAASVTAGVNNVRADDTSGLKMKILGYLNWNTTIPLQPMINLASKCDRGWTHPVMAALLSPLEYTATEETYRAIQEGQLTVTAEQYPRFLYPHDRVYNPDDIGGGILEGHLMIRVAKHIFQGPSTALQRPGYHRGKRGNASIVGLKAMTPHTIAYVALQTRFALTSSSSWSKVDTHFDNKAFFWDIVDMLEDVDLSHVLDLYNYHVFGTGFGCPNVVTAGASTISDASRLKDQRAAKWARRSVESTPSNSGSSCSGVAASEVGVGGGNDQENLLSHVAPIVA